MSPSIEPRFPYEDFGPYVFAHRLSSYPLDAGPYAPHLHIQAYHENVKTTQVVPCANETFELYIPRKFNLRDTERVVAENEGEMFLVMKTLLDEQADYPPAAPEYGSMVPYLGKEIEVRALPEDTVRGSHVEGNAVHVPNGLSPDELREAVLDVLGDMAYGILKPRLDSFAKRMGIQYRCLDIDDGRRTFGNFHGRTKEIFLSRRLLMMSESIIDFLIVHELAHGRQLSHGPEHDAVMSQTLPNHEEIDAAFTDSCDELLRQGWL